jgi:hypothetical protein
MAYTEGIGENGKLDDSVLSKIDTGQKLYKPAAISFMRMKNDAKKQGVNIDLVGDYSAYRPCGKQGDYTVNKCSTGFTQWCAWEKYKAGIGNLASNPTDSNGCSSNHGYGMAIDVKSPNAKKWVRANGTKYGWWWGEAPTEDWHFTYDLKKDTFLNKNDIPNSVKVETTETKSTFVSYLPYVLIGLSVPVIAFLYVKYKDKILFKK